MSVTGWILCCAMSLSCGIGQPEQASTQPVNPDVKRVLVVINRASEASVQVGSHYVNRRRIPAENVVRVSVSTTDTISMDEFRYGIREPIRRAIAQNPNPIDFIVLTKGVPIRLVDDSGWSVDGHLAGMNLGIEPLKHSEVHSPERNEAIRRVINPFFMRNERFSSRRFNMYLVTRLDGRTVEDAKALVDRSLAAAPSRGLFFFDGAGDKREGGYGQMQEHLVRADAVLQQKGFQSRFDGAAEFVAPTEPLMGYASWGSNDPRFDLAAYRRLQFLPGALAETFVSTSARTFGPVTAGQSVISDLIHAGVTGVKGYVSEPYTFALVRPDVLFDRYTSGFNLAESFYMASLVIKWKGVVVGDPLCAPFAKGVEIVEDSSRVYRFALARRL